MDEEETLKQVRGCENRPGYTAVRSESTSLVPITTVLSSSLLFVRCFCSMGTGRSVPTGHADVTVRSLYIELLADYHLYDGKQYNGAHLEFP